MTREQQDKLWNELSEESKKNILKEYNEIINQESQLDAELDSQPYIDIFGSHNLNPKPLTYEDVAKELFGENNEKQYGTFCCSVFSEVHCDKISAINALINVAKYLNGDWKGHGYVICINDRDQVDVDEQMNITGIVSFKTVQLAMQAIQILGEETIRLVLTTDY